MRGLLTDRLALIWLVLISVTLLSQAVHGLEAIVGPQSSVPSLLILALALFKVRLVIRNYMEVRDAPLALQLVMDGWALVILVVLGWFYL